MKGIYKVIIAILISASLLFVGTGYAELIDTLYIGGTATAGPDGVSITAVEVYDTSYATATVSQVGYTSIDTTIARTSSFRTTTAVFKITVHNYSKYIKYAYAGIDYSTLLGNDNSLLESGGLTISTYTLNNGRESAYTEGTAIEPMETIVFYAEYSIPRRSMPSDGNAETLINFKYGIHTDSVGAVAADKVITAFTQVLNTQESYETLIENIDNKYINEDWQANFIGNVSQNAQGATASAQALLDTEIIKDLFGENLQLTIDGEEKDITLIIKRENVDGNENTGDSYTAQNGYNTTSGTGCEMTLYMTAETLGGSYSRNVEVYVAVFTCESDEDGVPTSDWYVIGDIYKGYAPTTAYDTNSTGYGSFVTDDWVSEQMVYYVSDNFNYTVSQGDGRNDGVSDIREITAVRANVVGNSSVSAYTDLVAKLEVANAVLDGEYGQFAGEAVNTLTALVNRANAILDEDTSGNGSGTLRAYLIPLIKDIDYALLPFEQYING